MKVLVLGGTSESRSLASALADRPEFDTITSLAGRVVDPLLPVGQTRIGGFGGASAMSQWLSDNEIDAVVDATHPFASVITAHADAACAAAGVPLLGLTRPPWTPMPDDRWTVVAGVAAAAAAIEPGTRVFLTIGRQGVHHFAHVDDAWFLIRAIDPPSGPIPRSSSVILERGPFDVDHERELISDNRIDLLVTKNSGGDMTSSKLEAARALGVPVLMVERPPRVAGVEQVHTVGDVLDWLESSPGRVTP